MTISLWPEHEALIRTFMETGEYNCESEVVAQALDLLRNELIVYEARRAELRQKLDDAANQFERGEYVEMDEKGLHDYFERLKARCHEKHGERSAPAACRRTA